MDPTLPPDMQARLEAGALPLNDGTDENPSWASAVGAVTWIDALVGGRVLNAEYQAKRLDCGQPVDTWMFNDPTNEVTIVTWADLCPNTLPETAFAALMSAMYVTP